jgi:vitellogenic carboxypeptidase-like protein
MQSYAYLFPFLLAHLKVMLYQGQFDLKDGVVSSSAWIRQIPWAGQQNFISAARYTWAYTDSAGDKQKAGWVKAYENLTQVIINSAGHMAPMNNPSAAFEMALRFVFNQPFEQ